MSTQPAKRTANVKLTLNKRAVDALKPANKPFIAWDDKLTGFGVRIQPSGTRSYIVNYRAGDGGRKAANRRIVIGRHGRITPEQARRNAQEILGRVAAGEDPAGDRARSRAIPTLREAFEDYLAVGPERKKSTLASYRSTVHRDLGPWIDRPLDTISRKDIEQCFNRLTREAGWVQANHAVKLLRALYRRQCIDFEGLHNPVDQWRAAGGRPNRVRRRRIPPPAEVLPRWHKGIETAVRNPVGRDAFRFGLYTGMRRDEVLGLRWEQVNLEAMTLRVEETKTGEPLELPVTPPTRRHPRTAPVRARTLPRAHPDLGIPVRDKQVGQAQQHAAPQCAHRRGGRREVLVPRLPQLLHHRGGPRPDAPEQFDEAAGQSCTARGLDHGAVARERPAHRRPDRRADPGRDTGGGNSAADWVRCAGRGVPFGPHSGSES